MPAATDSRITDQPTLRQSDLPLALGPADASPSLPLSLLLSRPLASDLPTFAAGDDVPSA